MQCLFADVMADRKIPICAITSLPASYREPRTLTPYATIPAFKTLTQVIDQAYVWNDTLGAYTGAVGVGVQKEIDKVQASRPPTTNGHNYASSSAGVSRPKAQQQSQTGPQENPYSVTYSAGASARAARGSRGESDFVAFEGNGTLSPAPAKMAAKKVAKPKASAKPKGKGKLNGLGPSSSAGAAPSSPGAGAPQPVETAPTTAPILAQAPPPLPTSTCTVSLAPTPAPTLTPATAPLSQQIGAVSGPPAVPLVAAAPAPSQAGAAPTIPVASEVPTPMDVDAKPPDAGVVAAT